MVALAGGITEKAGNQVHLYRQDAEGRRQTAVIDLLVLANPAASQVDPKDAHHADSCSMGTLSMSELA